MFKVNNKDIIRTMSILFGVVIVDFKHISHLFVAFLLLTFKQVKIFAGNMKILVRSTS